MQGGTKLPGPLGSGVLSHSSGVNATMQMEVASRYSEDSLNADTATCPESSNSHLPSLA